jgi:hypothetical protein
VQITVTPIDAKRVAGAARCLAAPRLLELLIDRMVALGYKQTEETTTSKGPSRRPEDRSLIEDVPIVALSLPRCPVI